MQPGNHGPEGARCPQHPEMGATSVCDRCGRYMCEICSEGGSVRVCAECRLLTGAGRFPLSRSDWSFSRLLDHAWRAFAREWLLLSVGVLLVFVISYAVGTAIQFVAMATGMLTLDAIPDPGNVENLADVMKLLPVYGLSFVASFLQAAIMGVLLLGFFRMAGEVLEGGPAEIGRVFGQVPKAGRFLLQTVVLGIFGMVGMGILIGGPVVILAGLRGAHASGGGPVALLVAAVLVGLLLFMYVGLPLTFAPMELAWNDEATAFGAIRNAWRIASGHRLAVLGAALLAGLFALVGMLLLCIGYLPGTALGYTLLFGLYLTLRNGSEVARVEAPAPW